MQASHLHIDVAADGRRLGRLCSLEVVGRTQSLSSTDLFVLLGDLYKGTFACHLELSCAAVTLELM